MTNQFRRGVLASSVASIVIFSPMTATALEDISNVLPPAESGECYAKVLVPPVYKTETIKAIISEATESLEIVPAKYATTTERVLIKESALRKKEIQPEHDFVEKRIKVADAYSVWVRDGLDSEIEASPGALSDLAATGVNLDGVASGQCFYEHFKEPQYRKQDESVLVAEATEKLSVIPAKFATSEKQILVRAASKRLIEVPAVFKTVSDKVLVEPAKKVWKKGRGPIQRIDNTTGEIMCLVDVPAVYQDYQKRVVAAPPLTTTVVEPASFETLDVQSLVQDAQEVREPVPEEYAVVTKRIRISDGEFSWNAGRVGDETSMGQHTGTVVCRKEVPAEYEVLKQQIVQTAGRFVTTELPPIYKNVEISKLVVDATVKRSPIAAVEQEYIQRVKVSDARMEWRPVLCETNMTGDIITTIQKALAEEGYNPGSIDGLIGRGTLTALERFQKDKKLPQGGITYATLEALGIKL